MKNFKKIITLVLAFVMVMGMSMTAFAENEGNTVTVENLSADAEVSYYQVITEDQSTVTGYAIVDDVEKYFIDAFTTEGKEAPTEQEVIKMIIDLGEGDAASSSQLVKALSDVKDNVTMTPIEGNSFTASKAGLYVVKAVDPKYTYNVMAASVKFGTTTTTLNAKKSEIKVTKTDDDSNKVVKVDQVVNYTVTVNVPYINVNDTDKNFFVYDEITGAAYDTTSAKVYLGDAQQTDLSVSFADNKWSLDASSLINNTNSNAGKPLTITYSAKVTADAVENNAKAGHKDGSQYGSTTDKLYTGKITLTKTDKDGNAIKENSATFNVLDAEGNTLKFVKQTNGEYLLSTSEAASADVVTDENGQLVVTGLLDGDYQFKETVAPTGYSVNPENAKATLKLAEGKDVAEAQLVATTSMADSNLSSLPFTGGVGTTIFTVLGVAIMAIAAALFFATKKKAVR